MRLVAIAISVLWAGVASAQAAFPCGWQARADALVEPWEETTRTFANGAVRVALLDVAEPAAAAFYLLLLHPPTDQFGPTCTTIGMSEDLGYAALFFQELEAGYDPTTGLTFTVPAVIYLPDQDFQNSTLLKITVNQSTGAVTVNQALGNE